MSYEHERVVRHDKEFARLNGWSGPSEAHFGLRKLARVKLHRRFYRWGFSFEERYPQSPFDHSRFYRERQRPYRPVAIVTMPYKHVELADIVSQVDEFGLIVHMPPLPSSGWWFPGETEMFVVTRPDIEVKFLPEQIEPEAFTLMREEFEEEEKQDRLLEEQRKERVRRRLMERAEK